MARTMRKPWHSRPTISAISHLRPTFLLLFRKVRTRRFGASRAASRNRNRSHQRPSPAPSRRFPHTREKYGTALRGMTTAAFPGAPFIMHVPLDYRGDQPFPLIVYLSGGGGLAYDGAANLGETLTHAGYLVLIPHASGNLWWEQKPTENVYALLLEILRSYNVDTNRVYLVGFSNGGTAALEFGTRWPDRFAAVASLMGAGLDTPSGTRLPLENLLDVPMLFLHGDKDARIPASSSYAAESALRALKPRVTPEIHTLKGRGHDIRLSDDGDFTLPFLQRFLPGHLSVCRGG